MPLARQGVSITAHKAKAGDLLLAWETKTRKTMAENKTDVIPNRAERPVRNLLSYHSHAVFEEKFKTRKTKSSHE